MVSGNAQKTAYGRSFNQAAEKKVRDGIQLLGKSLPCSVVELDGWIVTVKFEVDAAPFTLPNVTVPVASSKYDYLPLEVGSPGVVRAADARLGGLSGLGGGTASLSLAANLSTLVFEPFGHVTDDDWVPPDDPAMRVVQGPNGVIVRDLASESTITLTADEIKAERGAASVSLKDDKIELVLGGAKITLEDDKVKIVGELIINGAAYLSHTHTGVQSGGSNTGGVS